MALSRRTFLALSGATAASAALAGCGGATSRIITTKSSAYDLVIIGASPAGIMAARQASAHGVNVCIVENLNYVGGMLGPGGLSETDSEDYSLIGGLSAQYFRDIATYYKNPKGAKSLYAWEPSAAMSVFGNYLDLPNITVMLGRTISAVSKTGSQIKSITLDNGVKIAGSQWIDASYEGDLMALSGVRYVVGRESTDTYGESLAGYNPNEFYSYSGYNSGATLIPFVNGPSSAVVGSGDNKIMANFWRATLSLNPSNSVPFPQPANYNRDLFEGILQMILFNKLTSHGGIWSSGFLPNDSFSMEAYGAFTDQCGFSNWAYPNASWTDRQAIVELSRSYQQGWMYFCANDSAVPSDVRAGVNLYGLAKDQFTDNDNWPYLLYLREGRRMVGKYVMTQNDTGGGNNRTKADSIGLGQWTTDCHGCDMNAGFKNGKPCIYLDGEIADPSKLPWELSFQSMVPNEVSNLLVPVCVSASHVGFCAIRTEPSFMILGEAAGAAAVQVLERGVDLSETDVASLQSTLSAGGSILKR